MAPAENLAARIRRESGAADAVRKHQPRCDNDAWITPHVLLNRSEIGGIWQEIVVEEHDDVSIAGGRDHGVALTGQAGLGLEQRHAGIRLLGAFEIRGLGAAHDHAVGTPRLPRQFAQRLAQNGSPPDGWNADHDPALHSACPSTLKQRRQRWLHDHEMTKA